MLRDVTFRSAALHRDMHYRAMLPASTAKPLATAYLLHGSGEDFRSWSNYSDVARFADAGLILVMPQGDYSYYVNAVAPPGDRYEDYITRDLIADVEAKFPASRNRTRRAIVGVSMGGFGAIKLALSHPSLYAFAGALSPAIDVPRRTFAVRRFQQSWAFRSIFGSDGSETRLRADPFFLAKNASETVPPYLFITCGDRESLLPPSREFAALLDKAQLPHEFHVAQGGHDWRNWNTQLPDLFASLLQHLPSN